MPHSRRRKFSVQNKTTTRRSPAKGATSETTSNVFSSSSSEPFNNKNKSILYSSMAIEPMEKLEECNENSSISLTDELEDKPDAGSSNNLDSPSEVKETIQPVKTAYQPEPQPQTSKRGTRSMERNRREKQHQHRARIRSPKNHLLVLETTNTESKELVETIEADIDLPTTESRIETVGTNTELTQATPVDNTKILTDLEIKALDGICKVCHCIDLAAIEPISACSCIDSSVNDHILPLETQKIETCEEPDLDASRIPCTDTIGTNTDLPRVTIASIGGLEIDRASEHSLDDMCRICHGGDLTELGSLISACSCRGTVGRVHVRCLERWLTESGKSRCELCGVRYTTRRVHRYGVLKALVMWFLSQNAKQLMVDSLGIMLMSPLAVLAAWLSGRTLASLMTQESQVTPWPLASTFVLACMTLVCYYCWIVSAATRHALGWWIWYRSQYEVRLQIQDEE